MCVCVISYHIPTTNTEFLRLPPGDTTICGNVYPLLNTQFLVVGSQCAQTLERRQDELAAFCELSDHVSTFEQYVDNVRNSAEWGGHLELRALSIALQRPIHVYSVQQGKEPLIVQEEEEEEGTSHNKNENSSATTANANPIRLSYHLHYYALGEHYNQVVPTKSIATAAKAKA
jgi:OTU-like cysteine protease